MATRTKLEQFFSTAQPVFNIAQDMTSRVGDGPFGPLGRMTKVSSARISKLPIEVNGHLQAHLRTYQVAEPVEVFAFVQPEGLEPSDPASLGLLPGSENRPEQARPPRASAFTELFLNVGAGAVATVSPGSLSVLKVSAEAAASAGIQYRLLLPANRDDIKADALKTLVARARPPHLLDLRKLQPGELHTLDTRVHLRFALSLEGGKQFDFEEVVGLFDGLSATIKAHAEATLHASLGWSLYDHMQLAVGRVNLGQTGRHWVRLRLQRLRRSELTLGAKLSLQVEYDLGQAGFVAVLDRILEIEPIKRFFDALEQLKALEIHKVESEEDWEGIREKLDEEVSELILEYIDVKDLVEGLPWNVVEPFFQDLGKLVDAYESLDDKVRSLWEGLLGRVDLGADSSVRNSLESIAGLDLGDLDAAREKLLSPQFRAALELFEALSGSQIEEVFVDARAGGFVEKASALAQQALDFLDSLPEGALGRLHDFAQRAGVESVEAWFKQNATSTDNLKQALELNATGKIRDLISRITDKAWDALEAEDLENIRIWAKRLVSILNKKDEYEERIRTALDKLKGEAGFSVGIEVGRLSERAALLDLELDTSNSEIREIAEKTLSELSARELIERLPDPGSRKRDEELGYRLRDSVFSYRRVRTGAISTMFTLLGIDRARQTIRVDEEVIRIQPVAGGERSASYTAGAVRRFNDRSTTALASTHELGVWLSLSLEGQGHRLERPYTSLIGQGLRVSYARGDGKTSKEELEGFDRLLQDVGFHSAAANRRLGELIALGDQLETELAFSIEMGEAASRTLMHDAEDDSFHLDFRNAAHRWFREPMIDRKSDLAASRPPERELLASIIRNPRFEARWREGMDLIQMDSDRLWDLDIGLAVEVTRRIRRQSIERISRVTPLTAMLMTVDRTFSKMDEAISHYVAATDTTQLSPKNIRRFGKKVATLLGRTPFAEWNVPLFNLWLLLARIGRVDREVLAEARGLAQLRYRPSGSGDAWRETLFWKLTGARVHEFGGQVFPFS